MLSVQINEGTSIKEDDAEQQQQQDDEVLATLDLTQIVLQTLDASTSLPQDTTRRFKQPEFCVKSELPGSNRKRRCNPLKEKISLVVDAKLDAQECKKMRSDQACQLFELDLQDKKEDVEHRRKIRAIELQLKLGELEEQKLRLALLQKKFEE